MFMSQKVNPYGLTKFNEDVHVESASAVFEEKDKRFQCDHRKSSSSTSPFFEYSRFTDYLSYLSQQERQLRLQCRREGDTSKWLDLEYYSDDVLANELESVYGVMDKSSQTYDKIFQNYKEERLDEIEEWILEEKILIKELLDSGVSVFDPLFVLSSKEVINIELLFSQEELKEFRQLSKGKNHTERFRLPRPAIEHSVESLSSLASSPQFYNLTIYDPQLNLPSTLLSPILQTYENNQVGEDVLSSLQALIHDHFTGISSRQFYGKFKGNKDYDDTEFSNFTKMLRYLDQIIWQQELQSSNDIMLYPYYMKDHICTPLELFRNIFHKFQFLLVKNTNGFLLVSEAMELFEDLFKFKLSSEILRAWDFATSKEFLLFLISISDSPHISIAPARCLFLRGDDTPYLILNSSFTKSLLREQSTKAQRQRHETKITENKAANTITGLPKIPPHVQDCRAKIPYGCMQVGDTVERVTSGILKTNGTKRITCVLSYYYTPTDFYVVLRSKWKQLNKFQLSFTEEYEALDTKSPLEISVNPKLLQPGLYVAVVQISDGGVRNYCRARYVQLLSDGKHKVFLADYGESINVHTSALRYLTKSQAHEFHLQAIWCSIYNILPQVEWDRRVVDTCYDKLYGSSGHFDVRFMNSIQIDVDEFKPEKMQWFVKATSNDGVECSDVGDVLKKMVPLLEVKLDNHKISNGVNRDVVPRHSLPRNEHDSVSRSTGVTSTYRLGPFNRIPSQESFKGNSSRGSGLLTTKSSDKKSTSQQPSSWGKSS